MNQSKLLIASLITLSIGACGQTGPLYLPDAPAPIKVPKQKSADTETEEQED